MLAGEFEKKILRKFFISHFYDIQMILEIDFFIKISLLNFHQIQNINFSTF